MTRLLVALVCLSPLASFATEGEATPESKPKLAVVPFTALSADVPMRAGVKAAGMLSTEFKGAEAFVQLDDKREKPADPHADDLATARKSVEEAKGLRAKKKFRLADEALQRALGQYRNAGPAVTDVAEVQDAWALLSAVQFNTGRDEEGGKSLSAGLVLAPERELPLAQTSTLFAKVVAEARGRVKTGGKGTLLMQSVPAGAPVSIDGVALGATPLLVREVPAGQHFWRAQLANGEVAAGLVEVGADKQVVVPAVATNKDPESRLLAALAQNKLDADAIGAAREHAAALGADLLVFGALSRDGKGLALDAFLLVAQTGELRRLARPQFDPELLSAGMEFFTLAGDMGKKGGQAGDPAKVPTPVSPLPQAAAAKLKDVKYGVPPDKENLAEGLEAGEPAAGPAKEPDKDEARKPVVPQRRVPLKKK